MSPKPQEQHCLYNPCLFLSTAFTFLLGGERRGSAPSAFLLTGLFLTGADAGAPCESESASSSSSPTEWAAGGPDLR